jgi:hypothetical protein
LEKIPRMLKSLAHKAESFNSYANEAPVVNNLLKEVCFDMQQQFVTFLAKSIGSIHGADDIPLHRELPLPILRPVSYNQGDGMQLLLKI